jgi:predicted nucleotidyltransferase
MLMILFYNNLFKEDAINMNSQTQHIVMMETIIEKLTTVLEPLSFVRAFWLVGSVAKGTVDEHSDLDFWIDFGCEQEEKVFDTVESSLSLISNIDFLRRKTVVEKGVPHITNGEPLTIHKIIYHLEGTNDNLRIVINWQELNNMKTEYKFDTNPGIEPAKILFDKEALITCQPVKSSDFKDRNKPLLEEAIYSRSRQSAFIEKDTSRHWYMESLYSYNCYVLDPLITILRLIYTPAYPLKYYNHISQHLPEEELRKLEYFAQIASLSDMKMKAIEAGEWFDNLQEKLLAEWNEGD